MTRTYEERKNEGYEIQTYDSKGNYSKVIGCDTADEVAITLIRMCNGTPKGYFPTIWLDGERVSEW